MIEINVLLVATEKTTISKCMKNKQAVLSWSLVHMMSIAGNMCPAIILAQHAVVVEDQGKVHYLKKTHFNSLHFTLLGK